VALRQTVGNAKNGRWRCPRPQLRNRTGHLPCHPGRQPVGKNRRHTEFQELSKASFTNHGRFNVTTDSGDMAYYTYEGSGPNDVKKPVTNKWKINSGTGKNKGINGSGGCSGTRHDDDSSDWVCTGTYSMGK
jgi:hypothetical protein